MPAVKPDYTAQAAKWAAVSTLVLTVLYLAIMFVGERRESGERDEPSALFLVFMGVGCLAIISATIAIITFIAGRLERRSGRGDEPRT
jgi:hypothetical protein